MIDDALLDPDALVDFAARHIDDFVEAGHNAYPGPELRMPDAFSAQLDAFFTAHVRRAFDAGYRTIKIKASGDSVSGDLRRVDVVQHALDADARAHRTWVGTNAPRPARRVSES